MDIKINGEEGRFKFRVCGILKFKNKFLAVKMNENNFFCAPGGHVELGEDTDQAVIREMREELGYDVKIEKLIAIHQNFFYTAEGKPFHELGFYYIVSAVDPTNINPNDYYREELDKGKIQHLNFKWLTMEELKEIDFRPKFLVDHMDCDTTQIITTRDWRFYNAIREKSQDF